MAETFLALSGWIVLFAGVGAINFWCYRHRSRMTDAEKREEDEYISRETRIW